MTQEDKELLLKDLCSRLPYNTRIDGGVQGYIILDVIWYGIIAANIESGSELYLLPYLRPMSSMTEEEDEWLNDRINFSRDDEVDKVRQKWGIVMQEIDINSSKYVFSNFTEILDWLNAHHFDYRGLIEKGLAIEAPERMYN
jgi:hypothetical protein